MRITAPDGTVVVDTSATAGTQWDIKPAHAGTYNPKLGLGTDIQGTTVLCVLTT